MSFYVDGASQPTVPFSPNFSSNNFAPEYLSLFQGTGKYMQDKGIYISREDFPNGYTLFMFDLASNNNEDLESLTKRGHTRISIQFNTPLQEPITVLMYAHVPATQR